MTSEMGHVSAVATGVTFMVVKCTELDLLTNFVFLCMMFHVCCGESHEAKAGISAYAVIKIAAIAVLKFGYCPSRLPIEFEICHKLRYWLSDI